MLAYLLRRFVFALLLVFTVSSAALILVKVAPGDYVDATASDASAETKDAMRERLGLKRTTVEQYGAWVADAVRLDFGNSMKDGAPVRGLVRQGAINTAILAVTALVAATLIGLPLGIISGSRRGALSDAIRTASIVMLSLPPLLSSLLLLAIAASTGWLPVGDMRSAGGSAWPLIDLLRHLIVPATALALPIAAMFERMQSQAMSEVVGQPYVLAAIARGVPHSRIVWRDALKPALRPTAAVYGLVVGALLSGSFAVESVTSWPGLGVLMLDALRSRDLYLVAGCAAAGSVFLAVGTIISDIALVIVDPRAVEAG